MFHPQEKVLQDSAILIQVRKFPFVEAFRLGTDNMWPSRCCNFQQLPPLAMLASTMDLLSNDTQKPHIAYPDYKTFMFKPNVYNLSMWGTIHICDLSKLLLLIISKFKRLCILALWLLEIYIYCGYFKKKPKKGSHFSYQQFKKVK